MRPHKSQWLGLGSRIQRDVTYWPLFSQIVLKWPFFLEISPSMVKCIQKHSIFPSQSVTQISELFKHVSCQDRWCTTTKQQS